MGALPWAVHISDGVLSNAWAAGGFAGMALLLVPACWRVRDEEIPRIALLSAAFFVASLIHIPLGPTKAHLLLNGLVGVVLGARAGLAIALGLFLQAALGHGGISALGVNACVMTAPALLVGGAFRLVRPRAHRLGLDFALGLGLGVTSVLLTAALNSAVLVWGGAEDWRAVATIVFLAHVPLAALEGMVLGSTVVYLDRVKPELLGDPDIPAAPSPSPSGVTLPRVLLFAVSLSLGWPGAAQAHRLEADYRILPGGRVQVESWFDLTGESPNGATVQVYRRGNELLTEGKLDAKGLFSFHVDTTEALRVIVSAGAGHLKEFIVPEADLRRATGQAAAPAGEEAPFADRAPRVTIKDVLTGVGFLLALAAFVLSVRNARALANMKRGERR